MNQYQNNSQVRFNSNKILFDKKPVKLELTIMNESFGQWLKSQRKARGYNQPELAKLAHTTKATISLLEGDKIAQPRFENLDKIAKALNVPTGEMRGRLAEWQNSNIAASAETHEIMKGVKIQLDHSAKLSENDKQKILDAIRLVTAGVIATKDK